MDLMLGRLFTCFFLILSTPALAVEFLVAPSATKTLSFDANTGSSRFLDSLNIGEDGTLIIRVDPMYFDAELVVKKLNAGKNSQLVIMSQKDGTNHYGQPNMTFDFSQVDGSSLKIARKTEGLHPLSYYGRTYIYYGGDIAGNGITGIDQFYRRVSVERDQMCDGTNCEINEVIIQRK